MKIETNLNPTYGVTGEATEATVYDTVGNNPVYNSVTGPAVPVYDTVKVTVEAQASQLPSREYEECPGALATKAMPSSPPPPLPSPPPRHEYAPTSPPVLPASPGRLPPADSDSEAITPYALVSNYYTTHH